MNSLLNLFYGIFLGGAMILAALLVLPIADKILDFLLKRGVVDLYLKYHRWIKSL